MPKIVFADLDRRTSLPIRRDAVGDWTAGEILEQLEPQPAPAPGGNGDPAAQPRPEIVRCRCEKQHEGIDDDKDPYHGCGRYCLAELAPGNEPGSWVVRPADPAYWPQAELLEAAEQQELTDAKASADAWATAMTTLLGILGVSGLLLSREVAQTIDRWPARVALFAALVASASCAWLAQSKARQAASGVPVTIPIAHTRAGLGEFAALALRAPADIASAVRQARNWAMGAAVFVALGTAILWFAGAPETPSTQVNIMPGNVCGVLVDIEKPGEIGIRRAKGQDPDVVRLNTIQRFDIVQECP